MQCTINAIGKDSNVKNFLYLSQVLDFKYQSKNILELINIRDETFNNVNVINI